MKKSIKYLIVAIILLLIFLGRPSEIDLGIAKWDLSSKSIPTQTPPTRIKTEKAEITIESFGSRQEIYKPGDLAFIDFVVKNTYGVPYKISVDWFYNGERKKGWINESTEWYNVTEKNNPWFSNYQVNEKGEWKVQLVLNYTINDFPVSLDEVDTFEVM